MFFYRCLLTAIVASVAFAMVVGLLSGSLAAAVWTEVGVLSLLWFVYLLRTGAANKKVVEEVRLDHYP